MAWVSFAVVLLVPFTVGVAVGAWLRPNSATPGMAILSLFLIAAGSIFLVSFGFLLLFPGLVLLGVVGAQLVRAKVATDETPSSLDQ